MGDRLRNKVAVVTGAGRGLGRAYALALAQEGAKVVINDLGASESGTGHAKAPADEVVEEITRIGGTAVANYDTVASMQGGENIIKAAIGSFGRLDILVNNAGFFPEPSMIWEMTEKVWDDVMAVHLKGHFACTKYACVQFLKQNTGGRIINISSIAGLGAALLGGVSYGTAKEGIIGFTRCVAREMGRYGVTCNAIRPQAFTRMGKQVGFRTQLERERGLEGLKAIEMNRPEDIAPLVVFLATDEAAAINGVVFRVRAGEIILYSEPEERKTIYKDGRWTLDDLLKIMPKTLMVGLVNPAPPQQAKRNDD